MNTEILTAIVIVVTAVAAAVAARSLNLQYKIAPSTIMGDCAGEEDGALIMLGTAYIDESADSFSRAGVYRHCFDFCRS